jgi:hypothetical protein
MKDADEECGLRSSFGLEPYLENGVHVSAGYGSFSSKLFQCRKCGYKVFRPLPSEAELCSFYARSYRSTEMIEAEGVEESTPTQTWRPAPSRRAWR